MNEQLREQVQEVLVPFVDHRDARAIAHEMADAVLNVIGLEQVTRDGLPLVVGRQGGNTTYWSSPKPPNPAMWSPVYTIRLPPTPDPQPAPVEHPGP